MKLYTQPKPTVPMTILFVILVLCSSFLFGCCNQGNASGQLVQYDVSNVAQGKSPNSWPIVIFSLTDPQGNFGEIRVLADNEDHIISLTEIFKGKKIETYSSYLEESIPKMIANYTIRFVKKAT